MSNNITKKRKAINNTIEHHKKVKCNTGATTTRTNNEDEESEHPDIAQILQHAHNNNEDMFNYKIGNHIYFTSDVDKLSINKLSKLIGNTNREYELTKMGLASVSSIDHNKLVPKPIYLHINSNGGSLSEGYRAMDIIKSSKIPIHTVAEGDVVSAASIMFMAGEKRYMTELSYMLIHQMSIHGQSGTFEEIKDSYENSKQFMQKIVDIYYKASNGKMKKKQITDVLKHDLYWNYETCKKYGLVDELWTGEL